MREIKFRAFLKREKVMVNVAEINTTDKFIRYYDTSHCKNFAEEFDFLRSEEPNAEEVFECIELMQFTGLEDYTGDDIYEGDIVEVVISNKPKRFEVLWDEGGAMFLFAPLFKTEPMGAIDFNELEDEYGKVIVIGNKFENPELLEGTV